MNPYYQDKWVTIYHGDCRDVLSQLDVKTDLIVTDPPYNFESEGGGFYGDWHGKGHEPRKYIHRLAEANCVAFDPITILPICTDLMPLFYGYFFCNKDLLDVYIKYARDHAYLFDVLVMAKYNPIPACLNHHLHDLEYIVMVRQVGTSYYKSEAFDDNRKFYLDTCNGTELHPATKPNALIQRMITVSSLPGRTILDPFLGSGTTCYCAKKLSRYSIGIEIDERYCEIAANRCRQEVMELVCT